MVVVLCNAPSVRLLCAMNSYSCGSGSGALLHPASMFRQEAIVVYAPDMISTLANQSLT